MVLRQGSTRLLYTSQHTRRHAFHLCQACRNVSSTSRRSFARATDLQTTDPLIAYRALAAKGVLSEDAEQIRALIELRKLTRTLQDYTPPAHLLGVLRNINVSPHKNSNDLHPSAASDDNINALVRYLSEEEQVGSLDTPQGLLLTGKPGTGKTFLVDLWFEHLPVQAKFRRHYHHLLLSIYRMVWVEAERRRIRAEDGGGNDTFSLASNPESVLPERGVGAVWERQDENGAKGKAEKSIANWTRKLRGMPFFRPGSDAPVPVSSLDGISIDDEANKGMDVIKLARLDRTEESTAGMHGTTLPMHVAAELFLTHGHILLLDELQLLDIASATLLRRILTSYWRLGGVVVATSNRVPEDLYANNVQRRSLVAFLGALKERCPPVEVGGRDWRIDRWKDGWDKFAQLGEKKDEQSFFFIKGKPDEDKAFRIAKDALVAGRQSQGAMIKVYGRSVNVPEAYAATQDHPSVASFTFDQLCDQPLGPADYLTIASTYEVLILDDVPELDLVRRNQARRLITLIDCLYESRTKILFRSQIPLTKIFFAREGAAIARENARRSQMAAEGKMPDSTQFDVDMNAEEDLLQSAALIQSETFSEAMQDTEEGFRPNIVAYGPIVENEKRPEPGRESEQQRRERQRQGGLRNLSIFSGEEERFAYQRAVSRLYEMSHPSWSDVTWRPLMDADRSAWQKTQVELPPRVASGQGVYSNEKDMPKGGIRRSQGQTAEVSDGEVASDFADEASYQSVNADMQRKRIDRNTGPPVLSPAHVWGVREDWGPKAGKWGRGVRGLADSEREQKDSESPRARRSRLRQERAGVPSQPEHMTIGDDKK